MVSAPGTLLGTPTPVPHNFSNSKPRVGSDLDGTTIFQGLKKWLDLQWENDGGGGEI